MMAVREQRELVDVRKQREQLDPEKRILVALNVLGLGLRTLLMAQLEILEMVVAVRLLKEDSSIRHLINRYQGR